MDDISHVIFIDESGGARVDPTGVPLNGVNSLWASAAVALQWKRKSDLARGVKGILRSRFIGRCEELKAYYIRRYLPPQFTCDDVAADLAAVLGSVGAHVWVVCSRAGCRPVPRMFKPNPLPKDSVRQLLFERICGYASPRYFAEHTWLVVWDLSDARELIDFSRDVAKFRNLVSFFPLSDPLTPALLGGLSHDWPGIQAADVVANLALHFYGQQLGLPDAKADRAAAFHKHIWPILKRDNQGKIVGWKTW